MRNTCTHSALVVMEVRVRWCVRCSAWQWTQSCLERVSESATSWEVTLPASRHLPAEETSPDDVYAIATRLLRQAQELEQDARGV